ncbi:MAG: prepilin-type N-terminal cleavage/methylation domain-containing protein [Candidatus Omnitrophica bacterium]|nr:prepilin-type N-terminal cleavage/methylation domain-containing protein [Candidatus Omnitrophota bacterium]
MINGFSLIELLIVISVIAVFAFLGLPVFRSYIDYSSLKKDGWILLSNLRSYRELAVVEHFNYKFDFDVNADTYTIEKRDPATGSLIGTITTVSLDNNITGATDTSFSPRGDTDVSSVITIRSNSSSDSLTINVFSTTGLSKISSS